MRKFEPGDRVFLSADYRYMSVVEQAENVSLVVCRYEDTGEEKAFNAYNLLRAPRELSSEDAYKVLRILEKTDCPVQLHMNLFEHFATNGLVEG